MKTNNNLAIKLFLFFGIYIVGIVIALLILDKVAVLPFNNPWGVVGLLTQKEYNPANDIIKFITIISLPSLILFILYIFFKKLILFSKTKTSTRKNYEDNSFEFKNLSKLLFPLSIIFVIIMSLNIPTYSANFLHVDPFHEGETLSPAISYMAGMTPYEETLFVHGIFADPLRSVIAFKLFGKSIGSERTFQSILKILSFVLLFVLLLKLFRQNYLYAHITFLILAFASVSDLYGFERMLMIPPRDIATFLFLIFFLSLNNLITNDETIFNVKYTLVIFFFSFVPLASFAYSIDRGFYLFATFLLFSPIMFLFFIKKGFAKYFILCSVFGLASAGALLGFLLRWNFSEFFKFVFMEMPKYKELMDGIMYQFDNILYLFPVAIIAFIVYWIIYNLLIELSIGDNRVASFFEYLKIHLLEICLLVMSIFFFRSALGNSDWHHVIYSSTICYILIIYIFIKYFMHPILNKNSLLRKIVIIFTIISVIYLTHGGINRIYDFEFEKNFPYTKNDSSFIPDNHKNTIFFLKSNLGENDNFFTMTSEAIWYYYINKPCPSRFSTVWFAAPLFYQQEVVNDLKNKNVKFILYKNKHWGNRMGGLTSQERLPHIDNYIRNNYSPYKIIDGNELWIKNNLN